jgi:colicin import membrane protein
MESKESSVLFSLKELMTLEEQRIAAEAAERSRRAEAAARAVEARGRQRHEDEEARAKAEEARTRADLRREQEQAAHLQAIHEGEIENARREAEGVARVEELRCRQEHERLLAGLGHDAHKRRFHRWTWTLGALVMVVIALGSAALRRQANDARVAQARDRQALLEEAQACDRVRGMLRAQGEELALLEQRLQDKRAPQPSPEPSTSAVPPRTKNPKPPVAREKSPPPQCDRWDPVCGALP